MIHTTVLFGLQIPTFFHIAVSINCGGTSSQNLTMFMSNNVEAGACSAQICKASSDIVQLRLVQRIF